MKDITLVLDPGHGGADMGATGNGVVESHKVLQLCLVAQYAMKKVDPTCHIELTRSLDVKPTFQQRAQKARECAADLVISLHINASANTSAHGFWVFHQHENECSKSLAKFAAQNAPSYFKPSSVRVWDSYNDRTIIGDEWLQRPENVLRSYGTTAMLLEFGFLSNLTDAAYLKGVAPQNDLVDLLVKITSEYRRLKSITGLQV